MRPGKTLRAVTTAALVLGSLQIAGLAQKIQPPPLHFASAADTPAQLAPKGWQIESRMLKEVDLNRDGKLDAAFVISHGGSDDADPRSAKHVLVLALRGDDGKLLNTSANERAGQLF